MDPTKTGPIALAEQRLRWAEARQRVLAQNIANADTPNYQISVTGTVPSAFMPPFIISSARLETE